MYTVAELSEDNLSCPHQRRQNTKAVLSQGEPRDAAVNFDTNGILHRYRHVHGFPIPATARLCWSLSAAVNHMAKVIRNQSERIFNADKYTALNFYRHHYSSPA